MATDANDRRLIALGRIVEEAATLEMALRSAFCALVGSKYAAVVAAGQNSAWLLERSQDILKVHREIQDDKRKELREALIECKAANTQRNMIHNVWGYGPGGETSRIASVWGKHELRVSRTTVEDVEAIDQQLVQCTSRLTRAVTQAFGVQASTETQLRWEDYLRSLSPAEIEAMIRRRAEAAGLPADAVNEAARGMLANIYPPTGP